MMRAIALLVLCLLAACNRSNVPEDTLTFDDGTHAPRVISLRTLSEHAAPTVVETNDPYYQRHKRFHAIAVEPALAFAFGQSVDALRTKSFILQARDGYAVPMSGEKLFEGGAYIAYDDADVPGFSPIGPQRVSPKPAYLMWTRSSQESLETHPRPWQLAAIRIASFEAQHPHVIPTGEATTSAAMHGFELFREHCVKCHAINREGGHVGPDLNVPQSIVEYRPEAQIRAYIRNPAAFRYGAMPAHPNLTDANLDALIAYFRAMSTRKHDVNAQVHP